MVCKSKQDEPSALFKWIPTDVFSKWTWVYFILPIGSSTTTSVDLSSSSTSYCYQISPTLRHKWQPRNNLDYRRYFYGDWGRNSAGIITDFTNIWNMLTNSCKIDRIKIGKFLRWNKILWKSRNKDLLAENSTHTRKHKLLTKSHNNFIKMATLYAKDQPTGFKNNIEKVAIVGVRTLK